MKRLFRILFFFVVIIVFLVFSAAVLFRILLPPAKLKRLAENGARAYLQRQVTIGSLSVNPFSGLRLRNAAVPVENDPATRNIIYFDDLLLKPRSLTAPGDFDAWFTARHGGHRFSGTAHILLDRKTRTITVAAAEIREGRASLNVRGTVQNPDDRQNMALDVTIEGDKAVLDALAGIVADLSGIQLFPEPVVRLNISGTPGNLKIRFNRGPVGKKAQKKVQ